MSHRIHLVESHKLVIYELFNHVDISSFHACRDYAISRGRDIANLHQLLLFRDDADVALTPEDLRQFRSLASGKKFGTKRVIVAKKDLAFGLSRMLELLRYDVGDAILVVRELEYASQVIGIPVGTLQAVLRLEAGKVIDSSGDS